MCSDREARKTIRGGCIWLGCSGKMNEAKEVISRGGEKTKTEENKDREKKIADENKRVRRTAKAGGCRSY